MSPNNPNPEPNPITVTKTLRRIQTLCTALTNPTTPLPTLLSNFTPTDPWALEHGLPILAPFLGRRFTGMQGLRTYFGLLAEMLEIEWMRFEGWEGWVVDFGGGLGDSYGGGDGHDDPGEQGDQNGERNGKGKGIMKVSLRGEARFRWKSTGQAWEEGFAYRIELVEEDGDVKVKGYEVWADTGAAYLASKGELDRLVE